LEEAIGYLVPEGEELDGEIYALMEVGQGGREAEDESEEGGRTVEVAAIANRASQQGS